VTLVEQDMASNRRSGPRWMAMVWYGMVRDALQHFRASGAMSPVFRDGVVCDTLR